VPQLTRERWEDIAVAVLIALFAWLAVSLHNSIAGLGDMARGIRDTGTEIQRTGEQTSDEIRDSIGEVAGAIGSVPIVGGQAAERVRETAAVTADAVARETNAAGRRLAVAGAQGERDAADSAKFVGWLAFLVPTALLLFQYLPRRLRWSTGGRPGD
jgi:hypothetical protein